MGSHQFCIYNITFTYATVQLIPASIRLLEVSTLKHGVVELHLHGVIVFVNIRGGNVRPTGKIRQGQGIDW